MEHKKKVKKCKVHEALSYIYLLNMKCIYNNVFELLFSCVAKRIFLLKKLKSFINSKIAHESSFKLFFYKDFSMCSLRYTKFSFFKQVPFKNIKTSFYSMLNLSKSGCKIWIIFIKLKYVFKSKNLGSRFRKEGMSLR